MWARSVVLLWDLKQAEYIERTQTLFLGKAQAQENLQGIFRCKAKNVAFCPIPRFFCRQQGLSRDFLILRVTD
jgi:hypothetical protein